MFEQIRVGIIGGAGYVGGELLRMLIHHPNAEICFVQSDSQQGRKVSSIHADLVGDCLLAFTGAISKDIDLLFLCGGHGQSAVFLSENEIPSRIKIIDMSQDFRLGDTKNNFGRVFVYGLSEYHKAELRKANSVANPGCFATAITLSLLPVTEYVSEEIHIHAITGSTGSGQALSATSHFSWRNNNVSIYKPFTHQHLSEINETLQSVAPGFNSVVNFLPVRGDFPRGIFTSIYFKAAIPEAELTALFDNRYQYSPFVLVADSNPDLKQVINTNKILIYPKKIGDKVLIISVMDNLIKGAAGQAVQNMNLMFGLEETQGLKFKSVAF
jgi:N-acetyl-gamma-glutamyl-phosphate reductase